MVTEIERRGQRIEHEVNVKQKCRKKKNKTNNYSLENEKPRRLVTKDFYKSSPFRGKEMMILKHCCNHLPGEPYLNARVSSAQYV